MNEPKESIPSVVVSALFAIVAGCTTYTIAMHHGSVALWYLPVARAWVFGQKPAGVAMSWYGRTGYVLVAALLAALLGVPLWRAVPRPSARFLKLGGFLAGMALIVAVETCVAANVNRGTKPLPSPDGRPVACAPGP